MRRPWALNIEKALEVVLVKNGKYVAYVPMFFILSTVADITNWSH